MLREVGGRLGWGVGDGGGVALVVDDFADGVEEAEGAFAVAYEL